MIMMLLLKFVVFLVNVILSIILLMNNIILLEKQKSNCVNSDMIKIIISFMDWNQKTVMMQRNKKFLVNGSDKTLEPDS